MAISEEFQSELADTVGEIVRQELHDFFDPRTEDRSGESARVSIKTLEEVEAAFKQYKFEVNGSSLTPATQRTYLLHAENFVRWLSFNFQPGQDKASRQKFSHGTKTSRWTS